MKNFMTEVLPWIIIIGAVAAPVLVNILGRVGGNAKRQYKLVNGLCIALGTGTFMFIVLKWDLWICIGCGILLGVGGFRFGGKFTASGKD